MTVMIYDGIALMTVLLMLVPKASKMLSPWGTQDHFFDKDARPSANFNYPKK